MINVVKNTKTGMKMLVAAKSNIVKNNETEVSHA